MTDKNKLQRVGALRRKKRFLEPSGGSGILAILVCISSLAPNRVLQIAIMSLSLSLVMSMSNKPQFPLI